MKKAPDLFSKNPRLTYIEFDFLGMRAQKYCLADYFIYFFNFIFSFSGSAWPLYIFIRTTSLPGIVYSWYTVKQKQRTTGHEVYFHRGLSVCYTVYHAVPPVRMRLPWLLHSAFPLPGQV